jgi:hypothetical protein
MSEDLNESIEHGFEVDNNVCPFVANPFPECYCFDMTSLKIGLAVRYCMCKYIECEKFKHES